LNAHVPNRSEQRLRSAPAPDAVRTRGHVFVDEYDLEFRHERAAQEPLLAVPDGIGWAWARGGDFRRRARPMVVDVIDV
jgi:hypothetical protein